MNLLVKTWQRSPPFSAFLCQFLVLNRTGCLGAMPVPGLVETGHAPLCMGGQDLPWGRAQGCQGREKDKECQPTAGRWRFGGRKVSAVESGYSGSLRLRPALGVDLALGSGSEGSPRQPLGLCGSPA